MHPWFPLQRFEFSALLLHEQNVCEQWGQQVLIRQPQELAHRAAHDHLAGALRNIACFEHGVILLDDALSLSVRYRNRKQASQTHWDHWSGSLQSTPRFAIP